MFSPEELNQAMKLDWPNQRIVDWHPAHLELIELNKLMQLIVNCLMIILSTSQVLLQKVTVLQLCKKRSMQCLVYGNYGMEFMKHG